MIRVNAEAAAVHADDSEAVHDIAAEATYMTRLLDDLLLLAGSDREGIDLRVERIDLADDRARAPDTPRPGWPKPVGSACRWRSAARCRLMATRSVAAR